MEGQVWRYKRLRATGRYVCFEDEAGQGLRPPKGRTWAGAGPPGGRVRGAGGGRVSIAGVACYGDRRTVLQLLVYRAKARKVVGGGLPGVAVYAGASARGPGGIMPPA